MHHTGMKKRQDTSNVNYVQTAFDMTDANGDGHITAHEYATFYVNNAPTFGLSYVQWVQALAMTLSQVDTNDNGKLEIDGMYCKRIQREFTDTLYHVELQSPGKGLLVSYVLPLSPQTSN